MISEIGKGLIATIIVGVLGFYVYTELDGLDEEKEDFITQTLEEVYLEGQKDALEGDIRIEKCECGEYHWIKSPWDGQTLEEYETKKTIQEGVWI